MTNWASDMTMRLNDTSPVVKVRISDFIVMLILAALVLVSEC
jgi:hypothetical protein